MPDAEPQKPSKSKIPPYLVAALTCDVGAVDPSTGKKSLIGIFNTLFVQTFPTSRAVSLYVKVSDGEGFYPIQIQFMRSDDEQAIVEAQMDATWHRRDQPLDFLLPMPPLPFAAPGRHEFRILMSDMYVGRAVLEVLHRQPTPPPQQPSLPPQPD